MKPFSTLVSMIIPQYEHVMKKFKHHLCSIFMYNRVQVAKVSRGIRIYWCWNLKSNNDIQDKIPLPIKLYDFAHPMHAMEFANTLKPQWEHLV
jgi:hypothetical protein